MLILGNFKYIFFSAINGIPISSKSTSKKNDPKPIIFNFSSSSTGHQKLTLSPEKELVVKMANSKELGTIHGKSLYLYFKDYSSSWFCFRIRPNLIMVGNPGIIENWRALSFIFSNVIVDTSRNTLWKY